MLAQEQNRLILKSSSHSRIDGTTGHMINYRPVYEHKGSTLSADSGYIYTDDLQREYFDAFGRVIITQPDGTMIFADKLNYAAEPELAILTNNVRMVDGKSILTTNHLTYNMKNSIGTYTGGGRIVNEADTITSNNAWYFNRTKDAYFRYDVIVRTPDVHIYTDTMRYNSESKHTYFYGPTNIKGKDGENLYTEDGYYNTESELAEFFKNNLYTETSRLLKGDTLYYDGKTGNGRAIENVVFIDTADQFFLEGQYGFYHKDDESILMTGKPLVTMVVKSDSDSTQKDSLQNPIDQLNLLPDSTAHTLAADSVHHDIGRSDSQQLDSLEKQQIHQADPQFHAEPADRKVDSVYMTADTLFSQMIFLKDYIPKDFKLDREGGEIDEDEDFEENDFGTGEINESEEDAPPPSSTLDPSGLSQDSLGIDSVVVDTIASAINSNDLVESMVNSIDSMARDTLATIIENDLKTDSLLRQTAIIPSGNEVDSLMIGALTALERPAEPDSLRSDSVVTDSTKTRIIKAFRNVRVFKSDLQAVADSAYYGYPDSMMRLYGAPMAWTQGSQLSGDSLFLQIKNEQIDNMLLMSNAFIVNTGQDSVKYNQIKGKKVTGFFTKGELERIFVDGNAESLAYRENKAKTGYTDMHHNRSGRIKLLIRDNNLTDFIPIRSTEGTIYPLTMVTQEQEILDGFIWKPSDRPTSKEDLLNRKREVNLPPAQTTTPQDSAAADAIIEGADFAPDSTTSAASDLTIIERTPKDSTATIKEIMMIPDSTTRKNIELIPDSVSTEIRNRRNYPQPVNR